MDREDQRSITRLVANSDRIIEALTKAGVALVGFQSNNHWTGALTALVALRLASGGNLAGGVAGTGVLAVMGLDRIRAPAAPTGERPFIFAPITEWIGYYQNQ